MAFGRGFASGVGLSAFGDLGWRFVVHIGSVGILHYHETR